ncbi:MAG: adenosylmethionine decarboxylase [Bacillota bacterium]|nr:adenosylmethionine decarboxylase [Bacillota bacterium]
MNKGQLGKHILVEFYNCDEKILNDADKIELYMNEAAKAAKATIVQSVFHVFNPHGISGAVIIMESHITIHTWPEYGYAAVDLFTCGDTIDPWTAFEYLKEKLKSKKYETSEVARGILERINYFSDKKYNNMKYRP